MIVLQDDNVNGLYMQGLDYLLHHGQRSGSRNGPVIVAPCPVTSVYCNPTRRVLFNGARDANPFFHLMEAIWMLAGRDDSQFLTRYAKQIGEYAENGGHIHGAYGHRWRNHFGIDQLHEVRAKLVRNPDDRQAVIQMWDCQPQMERGSHDYPGSEDPDNYFGADDLVGTWKDRPCNTHVYLRVWEIDNGPDLMRPPEDQGKYPPRTRGVLDMTVCCRSNDAIWGAYGANAVHFSVLQEYLAAAVGVGVGTYYQVSNNFHVYDNELLARCATGLGRTESLRYERGEVSTTPMVTVPDRFVQDCGQFCLDVDDLWSDGSHGEPYHNVWLSTTAWNMAIAHYYYKKGDVPMARRAVAAIVADDWRLACAEWLDRRAAK